MEVLKSIGLIINYRTYILTTIALIVIAIFVHYEIEYKLELDLVAIAVVFPLVFAIKSAYTRREKVLQHLANLQANGMAISFVSRDWVTENSLEHQKITNTVLVFLLNL